MVRFSPSLAVFVLALTAVFLTCPVLSEDATPVTPVTPLSLKEVSAQCTPALDTLLEWAVKNRVVSVTQGQLLQQRQVSLSCCWGFPFPLTFSVLFRRRFPEFLNGALKDYAATTRVTAAAAAAAEDGNHESGTLSGVTSSLVSKLDFLHVLYFAGSLLVIGSMTLFMTLGWEKFGGLGLFWISLVYGAGFGLAGIFTWYSNPEFRLVGGLLSSIAVSMTPLATYGLMLHFKWWVAEAPRSFQDYRMYIHGSWIPMNLTTTVVGFAFLAIVPFPFILAPASVALFFLSMDLVPLLMRKNFNWAERCDVSLWFGLGMLAVSYLVERRMGNTPDFAFWLYLFGLLAFWNGVTFAGRDKTEGLVTLYTAINVCLIVVGHLLDRVTFLVFGAVGATLAFNYFPAAFARQLERRRPVSAIEGSKPSLFAQVVRIVLVATLLGISLRDGSSFVEFIPALLGLVSINVCFIWSLMGKSEIVYLFHLGVNLGFLFVSRDFLNYWQQMSLQLVCLAGAVIFHAGTVMMITSPRESWWLKLLYASYRVVFCVLLSFTPGYLQVDESFLLVVGIGLVCSAVTFPIELASVFYGGRARQLALHPSHTREHLFTYSLHFAAALLLVLWSSYFSSTLIFYAGLFMTAWVIWVVYGPCKYRRYACFLALLCLFSGVYFSSSLLTAVATFTFFCYLSHLAYIVFKDSLLFPFILSLLGIGVIYLGIIYQRNLALFHALTTTDPSPFALFVENYHANMATEATFAFVDSIRSSTLPASLLQLSSPSPSLLLSFLSDMATPGGAKKAALFIATLTYAVQHATKPFAFALVALTCLFLYVAEVIRSLKLFKENTTPLCTNVNITSVTYASGTDGHGIVRAFTSLFLNLSTTTMTTKQQKIGLQDYWPEASRLGC